MEKRVVLAMVLSVAFLILWGQFMGPTPKPQNPPSTTPGTADIDPGIPDAGDPGDGAPGEDPQPGGDTPEDGPGPIPVDGPGPGTRVYEAVDDVVVPSDRADWTFTSQGGALKDLRIYGNPNGPAREDVPGDPGIGTGWHPAKGGTLGLRLLGKGWPDLTQTTFGLSESDGEVRTEMQVRGLRLRTRFRPGSHDEGEAYHGDFEVIVDNPEGRAKRETVSLELCGPWLPEGERPPVDDGLLVAEFDTDGKVQEPEKYSPAEVKESLLENSAYELAPSRWAWIGMRRDFFLTALVPTEALPDRTSVGFRVQALQGSKFMPDVAAPTFRIPVDVPLQGEERRYAFRVYAGPNSHRVLAASGNSLLDGAVPTRWLSIGPIESALSWLLSTFAGIGMGWGWAIICLTLVVRGAMFPLSRKSQVSMRIHGKKMARLKPKLDALKAKYKDPRKQQQKQMELMRKEGVTLLPGGCLIAFIQMPIWISLYGILQTTFEMRYEGFLWFDDLTAADHLAKLPFSLPFLGEWFNLLPILMMITWGISARLQPLPEDPQQRSQAKMMRWMPMLFGLFLYNFAAGLALYMTCSALWSIGEVNLIRKVWLSKIDAEYATPAPAAS